MPIDLTPPDSTPVMELLNGFRKSQVLFAAAELGLFDALESGPKLATDVAAKLSLSVDALERLLAACEMLGLVARSGESYSNTPVSSFYLTSSSPNRLLGYVNYSNAILWKLWDNLPDAIRDGSHQWKRTFGTDGPIFSQLFRTDADRRRAKRADGRQHAAATRKGVCPETCGLLRRWRCQRGRLRLRVATQAGQDAFRREGRLAKAHPGRIEDRIGDRGRARHRCGLADAERRHLTYREFGVERLVYCSMLIERHAAPRPPITLRRALGSARSGAALDWLLAVERAGLAPDFEARLLESRPAAVPGVRLRTEQQLLGDRTWAIRTCTLASDVPCASTFDCSVDAATFLSQCDGTRTVREHVARLVAEGMLSADHAEASVMALVKCFVAGGYLEVEAFPLPRPPA